MAKKREQWSSNFGFLMAAAGSAVGLGNIWKFPYVAGHNGGAIFLIFYILILLVIGIPILIAEMSVGRATHLNSIDACKKISPRWAFVGAIGFLASFVIMSYYCVIGGWVLKYIVTYILTDKINDPTAFFNNFCSSSIEPIVWLFIFVALTALIVMNGISNGIERISKIFLPLLFVFIIIIAINSLLLPGASKGVKFFFVPDFSEINGIGDIGKIFLSALGQVFFSLSLGMGTLITYGSYLDKNANITKNAVSIPVLDTMIAILAGLAILPAVFAYNLEPGAGPGLIFQVLPTVFANMRFGRFIAILFFVLVFFAAITSAISLLEVVSAYFIDHKNVSRNTAALGSSLAIFIMAFFVSLSFGVLGGFKVLGMNIFELFTTLTDKILMPIGGFLMCILVGYIWGIPNMLKEISSNGLYKTKFKTGISVTIRYIAPALILLIFVFSFM